MDKNDGENYKAKYFDLKARYIQSLDVAYRTGYEEGYNQGQVETQMQSMQMMQAQMGMAPPPSGPAGQGQPDQGQPDQGQPDQGQPQNQSEIDQYIQALEQEINKSEPDVSSLKKTLEQVKLAKSLSDIKTINPFQAKPYQNSTGYRNMNRQDQKVLNMQENIVNDVLSKWEEEEKQAKAQTEALLNTEVLKKSLKKSLDLA